ncbi:predicted protein [Chaetoceros tenuissimus]|uniref:MYND-type domain-containing protein n=1 Tax=Chaetoceros tenuissimus TaxID=426638 RepID=A0AAD3D4S8_9STRA|nr:predicted protein [Chaetoceros tenuissimus]
MGKKGKRSRRKAVTTTDQASIVAKIKEKDDNFQECFDSNLYSQAADELREGIQLIEATMLRANNIQSFLLKNKILFYSDLMWTEFDRRNFDGAIQIYEKLFQKDKLKTKRKMEILSDSFPSLELKYHEALLRQGKGNIDTFISLSKLRLTHVRTDIDYIDFDLENDLLRSADILRMTKHFDAAIVIGKQLEYEELTGDKVSLATTYLEQYLVEYYPKFGRTVDYLPENFVSNMGNAFGSLIEKHNNGGFNKNNAGPLLVLAQSTYLLHRFSFHGTEVITKAIGFLEEYLDLFSEVETHCSTCGQAGTPTEVQLVCSGCRVACYCSIDHQRMTWKKEAVKGMHFGHEVLCPVMKASRKWRHALSNDKDGEDDKVSRLRRRFERECLHCLSDGLGLRKKCFQK